MKQIKRRIFNPENEGVLMNYYRKSGFENLAIKVIKERSIPKKMIEEHHYLYAVYK